MATISATEARNMFTKDLVALYKEKARATSFLRKFFKVTKSDTKYISILVQRGAQKVAVDVPRHHSGNINTFDKFSEKMWLPPYYDESFILSDSDIYQRALNSEKITEPDYVALLNETLDKLFEIEQLIDRAYELQAANTLDTGIITLVSGDNVDFKRKAGALVDLGVGGTLWSNVSTADPYKDLQNGCEWIRVNGLHVGGVYNIIMGDAAWTAFRNSEAFQKTANLRNVVYDKFTVPLLDSEGAAFQGEMTLGSFIGRVWTYPQSYTSAQGVDTKYVDPKKVIIIADGAELLQSFAGIPRVMTIPGTQRRAPGPIEKGQYFMYDYTDLAGTAHIMGLKSAGMTVPVAVDKIYTLKVLS